MAYVPRHFKESVDAASKDSRSPFGNAALILALFVGACVLSWGLCAAIALAVGSFHNDGWFNRFWFAFFATCAFLVGFLCTHRSWIQSKPENVYLAIVFSMVMLFSFTISVRAVGWDIGTHYKNILVFADWQGDIDRSWSDMSMITVTPLQKDDSSLLASIDTQEEALDTYANSYAETVEHPGNALWYVTGVEYIPYALVMRTCRAMGVSFSHTLLLMRIAGGAFYALVTYFGMRKLRSGKMLYATIALLPSSVFLAVELGYSYWLFSLCLYGFASLVGMIQGSVDVTPLSLAKMLGSLVVGMLPRVVYFPLIFLCLFIPTSRFQSKGFARTYRILIVGAAVLTLGVWLVPRLLKGLGGGDSRGGDVNPSAQIHYILTHPLEYLQTFVKFVLPPLRMESGGADKEGVNLVSGFLSVEASPGLLANYGYLPRTHWAYTAVLWLALAWTTLTDKDSKDSRGIVIGVVALVLTFTVFVLIVTALYFDFTPVGLSEIHGVQRRYLLPLLFPLLAFVGPRACGLTGQSPRVRMLAYNGIVLGGMAALLLCSWWTTVVFVIQ